MKRSIQYAAALLFAVTLTFFSSCGLDEKNAVLLYKDEAGKTAAVMDKNFFSLWMSMQKALYGTAAKSDADWTDASFTIDGKAVSLAELVTGESIASAKTMLCVEYLADTAYRLKVTDEQKDQIDATVNAQMKQSGYADVASYNSYLSSYGATVDTLKKFYQLQIKEQLLIDRFYGEDGMYPIEEETKKQYFEDHYAIVTHIYFDTRTKTKSDGTAVSLTAEEMAEKEALANQVKLRLDAGEDFDALQEEYSEDAYGKAMMPYGYFVTGDNTYPPEFQQAALEMAPGDVRLVESLSADGQTGGIHIVKKLPMNAEYYNVYTDVLANITTDLESEDFRGRMEAYTGNVVENAEVLAQFDVMKIPAFAF